MTTLFRYSNWSLSKLPACFKIRSNSSFVPKIVSNYSTHNFSIPLMAWSSRYMSEWSCTSTAPVVSAAYGATIEPIGSVWWLGITPNRVYALKPINWPNINPAFIQLRCEKTTCSLSSIAGCGSYSARTGSSGCNNADRRLNRCS